MKINWFINTLTVFLPSYFFGWGTSPNPQITGNAEVDNSNYPPYYSTPALNFPFNEDQDWLTKGSLLVWKPYEDDVDTGVRVQGENVFTNFSLGHNLKMKHPDYDWSPGVRVGIGKYLPEHEWWDVSAFMTYYYNQGSSSSSPAPENNANFQPGWDGSIFGAAIKSDAHTQLNLYIWDLAVGRNYSLTPKIVLRPFFGVRGVLMDQKYTMRNISGFVEPTSTPTRDLYFKTSFKATQKFYGVGARIGTDFFFHFDQHWSLIANFSGSFLWARYKLRERFNGIVQKTQSLDTVHMRGKDADDGLRTNLEGAVGLGWEAWVNQHKVRIAPSILFEVSEWYAVNHWFSAFVASPPFAPGDGAVVTNRHYGDLGFRGGTLNIQFDY